jgi:hypothetical protein
VSFTAPTVNVGSATVTLAVTARNTGGASSAPATATITVNPIPDLVTILGVEYRAQKQRLIVTASTSSLDPAVQLFLNPYVTSTGVTFDPAILGNGPFVNVAGVLTLTLVGAPEPATAPATVVVRSSQGGVSAPSGLTKLR